MRLSDLIFFSFTLFSVHVGAVDCSVAKMLSHPTLVQNKKFWEELALINTDDAVAVKNLIAKFSPQAAGVALASEGTVVLQVTEFVKSVVEFTNAGRKAIQKLTPLNQKKFDEFIKIINEKGLQQLYENPGKWHMEKLKRDRSHRLLLQRRIMLQIVEQPGSVWGFRLVGHHGASLFPPRRWLRAEHGILLQPVGAQLLAHASACAV